MEEDVKFDVHKAKKCNFVTTRPLVWAKTIELHLRVCRSGGGGHLPGISDPENFPSHFHAFWPNSHYNSQHFPLTPIYYYLTPPFPTFTVRSSVSIVSLDFWSFSNFSTSPDIYGSIKFSHKYSALFQYSNISRPLKISSTFLTPLMEFPPSKKVRPPIL